MAGGIRKPRSFHLSCPYTSLPVCHCRLYVPAPPTYARNPLNNPRPRHENPLRRALLLEILYSTSPPPGLPQAPSPALTYALHSRAAHGTPPVPTTATAISAFARAQDIADEETLIKHKAREQEARDQVVEARQQLERLENREKDSEAAQRVRQDRLAETSDDASEPDPGHVRRRGRPRKTR